MSNHIEARVPVTALAFCGPYLFAGAGNLLFIYDKEKNLELSCQKLFENEVITNITVKCSDHSSSSCSPLLLLTASTSIRLVRLEVRAGAERIGLRSGRKCDAGDWVLDGCFLSAKSIDGVGRCLLATLITSHNTLLGVYEADESRSLIIFTFNPVFSPGFYFRTLSGVIKSWRVKPMIRICFKLDPLLLNKYSLDVSMNKIISSSRCILYSAHLWPLDANTVLVAAGTAFGEILVWSAVIYHDDIKTTLHKVFNGHEGSVFGVRIHQRLNSKKHSSTTRLLASCSDDRTIRLWDISELGDLSHNAGTSDATDYLTTRETGFRTNLENPPRDQNKCVALAWGHLSRIWAVRFLEYRDSDDSVWSHLISFGEDATYRVWKIDKLSAGDDWGSIKLEYIRKAAFHSGKNIWSAAFDGNNKGGHSVITGAADGAVILSSLMPHLWEKEFSLPDVLKLAQPGRNQTASNDVSKDRSSRDVFRTYAFVREHTFIATTNSGFVLRAVISRSESRADSFCDHRSSEIAINWSHVARLVELQGYSISVGVPNFGIAFLAGADGAIFAVSLNSEVRKISDASGKIAAMFSQSYTSEIDEEQKYVKLMVTRVGISQVDNFLISVTKSSQEVDLKRVNLYVTRLKPSIVVTSAMSHVCTISRKFLAIGTRDGRILVYPNFEEHSNDEVIEAPFGHDREAVTAMTVIHTTSGCSIVSVGRNGGSAVHVVDLDRQSLKIVHKAPLPFGPNIEGLYITQGQLICYGFRSKSFVLYNLSKEQEIMAVECGGVHRNWSFGPAEDAGVFVCTRAGNVFVGLSNHTSNHVAVRGTHGREMKSVATCVSRNLFATGAEDTDIKIWESGHSRIACLRTVRRHTTGIQNLQWSEDGRHLFSSGGCEEFFVWRIRNLPLLGVGVVCEGKCPTRSETLDLRIPGFDVKRRLRDSNETSYVISLVYSDSVIRVFHCDIGVRGAAWTCIFSGSYMTSCLTQCVYVGRSSDTILTAGTDGHIAYWVLPNDAEGGHDTLHFEKRAKIHHSTVKSLNACQINDDVTIVITGGDDNGIGITLLRKGQPAAREADTEREETYFHSLNIPRAHAAAVTAVKIIRTMTKNTVASDQPVASQSLHSFRIISSGADQRIKLWAVDIDLTVSGVSGVSVRKILNLHTAVADVSSLALLSNPQEQGDVTFIVCGVGLDVWGVELG